MSDYVVPACRKYISGKLRSFSKNFSKKFFHTTFFENFLLTVASVANAKNQTSQGLYTPKSPIGKKIDFFKVRDIVRPIKPRKREHQTNVSSTLKTF